MKTRTALLWTIIVLAFGILSFAVAAEPTTTTVTGYVLDSACAFTKNITKPVSKECAISCAKSGSPLVILSNGQIYWPISDATPAAGQNDKLLPFAAQKVTVTGRVFMRGGSRAIVIDKVELAPAAK